MEEAALYLVMPGVFTNVSNCCWCPVPVNRICANIVLFHRLHWKAVRTGASKMGNTLRLVFVFIFASLIVKSESAKILGLFATFGRSHLIIDEAVMQPLIDRGHDVTIVTTLPLHSPIKGCRHIQLNVPPPPKNLRSGANMESGKFTNMWQNYKKFMEFSLQYGNRTLNDPAMRQLMSEEVFDLVILDVYFNTFQIGLAAHFKCPFVFIIMQRPIKLFGDLVGNPLELTYVPNVIMGNIQPMSFLNRVKNVLATFVGEYASAWYLNYRMEEFYNYNFPSGRFPSYKEMIRNISLILTCSHFSEGTVRPNVPAVIEIAGIQAKSKPYPLPKDIKEFLDSAKDGAVYFSLGSNIRSVDMNLEKIKILYKVLSELKQRVIWKWEEGAPPGRASNILFKQWFPQDDILAHPNVKLFITHGGHGSVVESKYHGVPMVGIPLFSDQFSNVNDVVKAGYGLSLRIEEITVEKFRSTVEEVLYNPTYRIKLQEFSRIYRDRPMSPKDTAAYWIEYVIRHRGAKHMQSPAVHMNFIQLYGLDVFAFLFVILYVVFKVLFFVFRKVVHLLFGRKYKNQKQDSNKQKKNQ
ncbi:UDP-glucosyltransferase 2-like isoform X3 [Hermetia illucens]|uniref:UDP-glucosyltransferase 2-like isoform X3 n=1 Tax=Hermetia illucens TaxID=343691 RepID=UPI0018CC395A|nr:UDP-glucosyltransferase 2-like isoform X3 [Hermetia illucens]